MVHSASSIVLVGTRMPPVMNLREYLGEENRGPLIIDETDFLKEGEKSCGVDRQYMGRASKTENAQVSVFLCYASEEVVALIDRALSCTRRVGRKCATPAEAGVPKVMFATKGKLARGVLHRERRRVDPNYGQEMTGSGGGTVHNPGRRWRGRRGPETPRRRHRTIERTGEAQQEVRNGRQRRVCVARA